MAGKKKTFGKEVRVNDEIQADGYVRLVFPDEGISKVVTINEARKMANERGLDLIETNGKISPPIIRMDNYSKYMYRIKKSSRHKPTVSLKEIQLSVNISSHDLEIKSDKARKLINNGDRVKVVLTLKGREMLRREENKLSFYRFVDMLSDISVPENTPKDEGNKCMIILRKK